MVVDLGALPPDRASEFMNMSPEVQQNHLRKLMAEMPQAFKDCAGFCTKNEKHVKLLECIKCAREEQGMKKLTEWESCKASYLSKP